MEEHKGGWIRIFTYKTGVLSPIAHDLRLSVDEFSVRSDGVEVDGSFDLTTIRVEGAIVDGSLDPALLSSSQMREILETIRKHVLATARHPEARFSGKLQDLGRLEPGADERKVLVAGELLLHGRGQQLRFEAAVFDAAGPQPDSAGRIRATGDVSFAPSRWGIKPYSALLGAIKLKDEVTIRFELEFEQAVMRG